MEKLGSQELEEIYNRVVDYLFTPRLSPFI